VFIDEINTNKLHSNNTVSWVNFLKIHNISKENLITNLSYTQLYDSNQKFNNYKSSYIPENVININFLRHERLYTKLKYSRSPAFDIVSGGAAALLAGFLGFLISEKFGFELVDSGDFYYLFMYIVFFIILVKTVYVYNKYKRVYTIDTFL
jgi:hypothetical protein